MLPPDLPPPAETPILRPTVEVHQPAPARDPKEPWEALQDRLEALSRYHSSALVSVLPGGLPLEADDVADPEATTDDTPADDVLAAAVQALKESLGD